jgi:hypothetical protein
MSKQSATPSDTMAGPGMAMVPGNRLAENYGFVDPLNAASGLSGSLYGPGGVLSSGPLGTYDANANRIASQVAGLSGPLEESLTGIATRQANRALDTTASNFANNGALFSGAGAAAMGEAMANPFANAQAQLQNAQLTTGAQTLQQLLGLSGNAYQGGLSAATGLMENTSGTVAPSLYTDPNFAMMMQQQAGKQASQAAGKQAVPQIAATLA